MDTRYWAADNLAARLLAGPWTARSIASGIRAVLGWGHLTHRRALTVRLVALADGTYPPAHHELTEWLVASRDFLPPWHRVVGSVLDPPRFAPIAPFAGLAIPALPTPADLAEWAGLTAEQLDWLANERRGHHHAAGSPLQHYHYAFTSKRVGPPRLIEAPKPRLKAIQRRILREILNAVPPHDRANGFVRGRSCLTGAQSHANEAMVATFDLAGFFPSIRQARVHGLFRCLGYPWAVARRLAGLCTTITPASVRARFTAPELQSLHGLPHLPQGAPTSPALANLLAWNLDRRLHGLARVAEANYTRYADDLAFSGDTGFARRLDRFRAEIETIVGEEGFSLHHGKTRIMPRSARQRVTGIVVNEHCNVGRAEFDRLKAILHNRARTGPADQNREAMPDFRRHLDGRIAWVEQINPRRGAKLRCLFDRIDWQSS